MTRYLSRLTARCCTGICLIAALPLSAFADTTEPPTQPIQATAAGITEMENTSDDDYFPLTAAAEFADNAAPEELPLHGDSPLAPLPAAYDMRELGVITSVKDQGLDGMCWAFATLGAAESYLLDNQIVSYEEAEPDLSEEQVGYYLYTPDPQPLSPTYEDAIIQKNKGATGGNALHASFFLSTVGVQEEQYLPYKGYITEHSEYQRYASAYRMTGSEMIMSVRTESERDAIKSRILENGSVYVAFRSNSLNYYDNGTSYAYYQSDYTYYGANHAVLLVGWDDDYPKENFDPKNQPATDGAWLVKNSWGDGKLDDGYFWLSYADQSLGEYSTFTFEPREASGNLYFYDNAGYSTAYSFDAVANVFQAEEDETLSRVGFYQCSANGTSPKYTIQIYRLPEDTDDPTDGELLSEKIGYSGYFGYQEITLSEAIPLQKGDRFSVVLSLQTATGKNGYLTIEEDYTASAYTMQFSAQAGQSYILDQGSTEWADATTMKGDKGNFHNVNLHAIMAPKETELDTTQLTAVSTCAAAAGETELAQQADSLLEQAAAGTATQIQLDCTAAMLLDVLSQKEVVTYPDYAYQNAHFTWGDIDEDGSVTVEDAVLCLTAYARRSAGLSNHLRFRQMMQCDVTGRLDGITVEDAVEILTYYARNAADLPASFSERQ